MGRHAAPPPEPAPEPAPEPVRPPRSRRVPAVEHLVLAGVAALASTGALAWTGSPTWVAAVGGLVTAVVVLLAARVAGTVPTDRPDDPVQ